MERVHVVEVEVDAARIEDPHFVVLDLIGEPHTALYRRNGKGLELFWIDDNWTYPRYCQGLHLFRNTDFGLHLLDVFPGKLSVSQKVQSVHEAVA